MEQVYAYCVGDKNNNPIVAGAIFESLEDAIQETRRANKELLDRELISLDDVGPHWEPDADKDIGELLTAGLVDKNIGEIAETARFKFWRELSKNEIIDEVIRQCLERDTLPCGWRGVRAVSFFRTEED